MTLTTVEVALMGILDRWAYQRNAMKDTAAGGLEWPLTGGDDVWTRVDAAGDETFENRVKGQHCTDLDLAFHHVPIGTWTQMGDVLSDIIAYVTHDLGYAGIDAYLAAKRWRMDLYAGAMFRDRYGTGVLSVANVPEYGDADVAAPGYDYGGLVRGGALTGGADNDPAYAPNICIARVIVKGVSTWDITCTVVLWDNTNKAIALAVPGSAPVGTTYVVGAQAINAPVAAGQKVVTIAATGQFKAGQQVLLTEWTGAAPNEVYVAQETATIGSVQTNVSLTMVDNLLHDYTAAGFVWPTVKGVYSATGTGGSASDEVTFRAGADRRLKL